MKLYVVSGFYYFNNDTFEIDEMPQSVHTSLEEANNTCELEFNNFKEPFDDVEVVIRDDGTKICTAYDNDCGDRVIIGVNAYEL